MQGGEGLSKGPAARRPTKGPQCRSVGHGSASPRDTRDSATRAVTGGARLCPPRDKPGVPRGPCGGREGLWPGREGLWPWRVWCVPQLLETLEERTGRRLEVMPRIAILVSPGCRDGLTLIRVNSRTQVPLVSPGCLATRQARVPWMGQGSLGLRYGAGQVVTRA